MARFDLSLDELQSYRPALHEPADFDVFWAATLADSRRTALDATFAPVDFGLRTLESFDVTFGGYGGQRIKGWLLLPRTRTHKVPCVVSYLGYGGGRGTPLDNLAWASAGYAHLVMDTRGQGSAWQPGDTPDHEPDGSDPQFPGFMTRGILSPATYYYRRVFTDGVRAVEAAQSHPAVDSARIILTGGSQGGGIALAVAGLGAAHLQGLCALMPDVPFLCHYQRATEIIDTFPYQEIVRYCKVHRDAVERVFATLGYFDGVHFARRAVVPALFSVGLMDDICPPSTVYAAFNHYTGPKEMQIWPYNNHEGGGTFQLRAQLAFLQAQGWAAPAAPC